MKKSLILSLLLVVSCKKKADSEPSTITTTQDQCLFVNPTQYSYTQTGIQFSNEVMEGKVGPCNEEPDYTLMRSSSSSNGDQLEIYLNQTEQKSELSAKIFIGKSSFENSNYNQMCSNEQGLTTVILSGFVEMASYQDTEESGFQGSAFVCLKNGSMAELNFGSTGSLDNSFRDPSQGNSYMNMPTTYDPYSSYQEYPQSQPYMDPSQYNMNIYDQSYGNYGSQYYY